MKLDLSCAQLAEKYDSDIVCELRPYLSIVEIDFVLGLIIQVKDSHPLTVEGKRVLG